MEPLPTPSTGTRVYDRAGNCLDFGCDGSIDRPCFHSTTANPAPRHLPFQVDWDADPSGGITHDI